MQALRAAASCDRGIFGDLLDLTCQYLEFGKAPPFARNAAASRALSLRSNRFESLLAGRTAPVFQLDSKSFSARSEISALTTATLLTCTPQGNCGRVGSRISSSRQRNIDDRFVARRAVKTVGHFIDCEERALSLSDATSSRLASRKKI
jgi:hypothetical protein